MEIHLRKLTLTGFKNYREAEFLFSPGINCLVGKNGVGKTNLLDAIHYLSFCKSWFHNQDILNIRHGEEFFALHGHYETGNGSGDLVQCFQRRNQRKRFLINKKEYERLADHIGLFPLVMISPYDRDLINEGSEIRRKYIDGVISQFDRSYLNDLLMYQRALFQRNALLRNGMETGSLDLSALDLWDDQLIPPGTRIFRKREAFLADFGPVFQNYYRRLGNGSEEVEIRYVTQCLSGEYASWLLEYRAKDRAAGSTGFGIHKDDLEFLLGGYPVKRYGSQGQQKSFVIAIKLAQFEYMTRIKGFKPLLLLDDIFDKLDDDRVTRLIGMAGDRVFGQVFITDTSRARIRSVFETTGLEHAVYEITTE